MADVHSLDLQRVYNLRCWIYGSNPEANGDLVADGELPEDRAGGCQEEWPQLDQAWSTLLDPYFHIAAVAAQISHSRYRGADLT